MATVTTISPMPFSEHDFDPGRSGPHEFVTTHWSAVLEAQRGDPEPAGRALEILCRAYWRPIYAFVRRRGFSVEDTQDLTQEFFTRLLQCDFLKNVAREKGRFRSFLLAADARGFYLNGSLDEPSLYNRALTACEVQAIHNAGHAGKCRP